MDNVDRQVEESQGDVAHEYDENTKGNCCRKFKKSKDGEPTATAEAAIGSIFDSPLAHGLMSYMYVVIVIRDRDRRRIEVDTLNTRLSK